MHIERPSETHARSVLFALRGRVLFGTPKKILGFSPTG